MNRTSVNKSSTREREREREVKLNNYNCSMYMVNAYDILSNNTILLQRCSKRGYKMIIFQNKKNQFQIQSRKFK